MKNNKGISLIVFIVTIIVVIILSGVVIVTLNKNSLISGAKEAKFKQDIRSFQDELILTISKEYISLQGNRDSKISATEYDDIKKAISSFAKEYEGKFVIEDDRLVYEAENLTKKEIKWLEDLHIDRYSNIPKEWRKTIASLTEDGVPVPKGFTYVTGTKDTGTVIQDEIGNQFVWVPATADTYVKDLSFPAYNGVIPTEDDTLPNGIEEEITDVVKYGGFYIGRFEAGMPDTQTSTGGTSANNSNKVGVPVCKQGAQVWNNINYINAKVNAEQMISNECVQTGLPTGRAWDRTCHFIEDTVNIRDSRMYGNYMGTLQVAGYSDKWMVKNIYDLAGNVYEWTSEKKDSSIFYRGGGCGGTGYEFPVSCRRCNFASFTYNDLGFRPRLYIK